MLFKKLIFNNICRGIKSVRIQGATNVAKAALKAYFMFPSKETKKKLLSLRPTEPMLHHVLDMAEKGVPKEKILFHFSDSQAKISKFVFNILKNNSRIFTHCHSTNVIRALIYAKKKGRNFEVYNTETRPLFQGRQTARELSEAGIKVTNFVDSAVEIAIAKQTKNDREFVDAVFLGADALLKNSVINKVGSGTISRIAFDNKIPVYIIADSWKYSGRSINLEQRNFKEVWNPGKNKIHIRNPAFEAINPRFIKAIVSEIGVMPYKKFLNQVKKRKY